MHSPWGELRVSDAHIHFFSHGFFAALAAQKGGLPAGDPAPALGNLLGWQMPAHDPLELAAHWVRELDHHGVSRAAMIASIPGDEESSCAAAAAYPARLAAYAMFNPLAPDCLSRLDRALARGLKGVCLFPAMHRFSMHDDRVAALLDRAAQAPGTIIFAHCGALSVGVRDKLGLPSPFDLRFSNPIDLHAIALQRPELAFVIPHFGAGYFREALMVCDLCPNVYLDTSSSNGWVRYQPEPLSLRDIFRRALDTAGAKRLLFGTDSSYFPRGWNGAIYEAQTRAAYEVGLPREEATLIFGGNLERLLNS
jgi:predicted TIM-barrel fold metal-dependent hydrolase